MRDDQRPQSPWARGAQAAERQPAPVAAYPPIQELPLPEYPPGNLKYQHYDESSWGYAEYGYEPEYPEYPRYAEYPEYAPEPETAAVERPRRERRRMLVVVAAVAAAVGGGALVAVAFGGSSHPQRTHKVADSRRTTGDPTVGENGSDSPSPSPTTASPSASASRTPAKAAKPAAPPAKPAGPAPLRFTGTTGPGCATSGTATFKAYGDGWNATGGNAGTDGCGGQALYAETGDSSGGVPDGVIWSWNPGWNRPATCTVSVFVPNSDKATATRVGYQVIAGQQPAGSFRVNQSASRGRWVTSPPYQTSGAITVLVDNRGQTGSSLVAGAARATCTG